MIFFVNGDCNFVVILVVEVCVDYGDVCVLHVCFDLFIVYGVGFVLISVVYIYISEIKINHKTTKPIVIGEPEWCLMIKGTENNKFSHKHNIVHFIWCVLVVGDSHVVIWCVLWLCLLILMFVQLHLIGCQAITG